MRKSPYSLPEIYEIAFSFRNYSKAVEFLKNAAKPAGLNKIESMVELGCGQGQYCRQFAHEGSVSYGLDITPTMVDYLNQIKESEKINCDGLLGDFRNFKLPQKVNRAICMMDTFSHLLTNDDVIDHLNAVADNLTSDGIYIIELSHPKDILTVEKSTNNVWTLEKDNIKVTTDWGSENKFDPLTEIVTSKVKFEINRNGEIDNFESETQTRLYTAGLIRALIEMSGKFYISAMYGDIDINQPFDNSKKSWRMVLVLTKF